MSFNISDKLVRATGMSQGELALEIALMLFEKEKLTLAQASRMIGISQFQFQHLLASRQIPIHYDVPDLEEDVQTLRKLGQL